MIRLLKEPEEPEEQVLPQPPVPQKEAWYQPTLWE